ncbi:MAG: NIPSNAP family protein [Planctomycetaceae bacterium]
MKVSVCLAVLLSMAMYSLEGNAMDDRLYELRTYHANPGKLDALHARFRDHTVKLFEKHGMTNIGYWVPRDNKDNVLIYVLAFPNETARDQSWKDFLADEDWKAAYSASTKDGKLIGRIDSVLMQATDYSPPIKVSASDADRLFELRTYTTHPGKLDGLNARFRDHTTALFTKHGLPQFAYWTPTKVDDGRDNKLIYILAVKDEATRQAGFDAFRDDADWKAARDASEANGPLLIKGGVESVLLVPTDYSPTK